MAKSQLANNNDYYRRELNMLNMFGALMYSFPALEYFIRHECGGAVFSGLPGGQSQCCGVFDRALPEGWTNQFTHVYVWA